MSGNTDPQTEAMVKGRLATATERHLPALPPDGAERAVRTAAARRTRRTAAVAAGALALAAAVPVAFLLGADRADRGSVVPVGVPTAPAPSVGPSPSAAASGVPTPTASGSPTGGTDPTGSPSAPAGPSTEGDPAPVVVEAPTGRWSVVGVRHDDVLNVREAPSPRADVLATVSPTGAVDALGIAAMTDDGVWWQVTDGWVNAAYLALPGSTDDVTSTVVERHVGIPAGSDMEGLARVVVDEFVSPGAEYVTVVPVSTGDLTEMTVDVLGLEDDSVRGYRLHLFASQEGGVLGLRSVEATVLCGRGVTDDGLCV